MRDLKDFTFWLLYLILSTSLAQELGGYKSPCDSNDQCNSTKYLSCLEYSCSCSEHNLIWDNKERSCKIKEAYPCSLNNKRGHTIHSNESCVGNSTCIAGKCRCDEGFLRDGFGRCKLSYGKPCDPTDTFNDPCSTRYLLRCAASAQCKCVGEGVDHFWDYSLEKCVSLVGSGCDMTTPGIPVKDDNLDCVENAVCSKGFCECKIGYSDTPDRQCLLSYGQPCDNKEERRCNKHKFLNCGDTGKCGCEFYGQMEFDEGDGECKMLAEEFCDLEMLNGNQAGHKCVKNANCLPHPHSTSRKGKCVCSEGMFKSENGTCTHLRGYRGNCSYTGDCNQSAHLICTIREELGGFCDCIPNEMYYNETAKLCLVYPGKSCTKYTNCGPNSNCNNGDYCVCNEGFVLNNSEQTCIKIPAGPTQDQVVPNISQISTERDCVLVHKTILDIEMCTCNLRPQIQIWSEWKQSCLNLVGSACKKSSECVEFAICDEEVKTCQCDDNVARTAMNRTCFLKGKLQNDYKELIHQITNDPSMASKEKELMEQYGLVDFPSGKSFAIQMLAVSWNLLLYLLLLLNFL